MSVEVGGAQSGAVSPETAESARLLASLNPSQRDRLLALIRDMG
jgi:hypothetical protein